MVPEPWASMYDPNQIPKYGFKEGEPDCFILKPPFYQEIIEQTKGTSVRRLSDPDLPGPIYVSSIDWPQEQVQKNAACYYGMITLMDKYIGKILDKLEETGEIKNTIIIFTSDHGDLLGDHGMYWKSLVAFEESMRIPFIVSYPNEIPKGKRSMAFQSLIDIAPTLLSFVGANIPYQIEGINQKTAWLNPSKKVRDDVVVEERPFHTGFNIRVLIDDNYKLCFYADRDYGELYDIKKDPHQISNLWTNDRFFNVKQKMINRILSQSINKIVSRPTHTKIIKAKYIEYHFGELSIGKNDTLYFKDFRKRPIKRLLYKYFERSLMILLKEQRYFGELRLNEFDKIILTQKDGNKMKFQDLLKDFYQGKRIVIKIRKLKEKKLEYSSCDFVLQFSDMREIVSRDH
jgi:hypothetical protein